MTRVWYQVLSSRAKTPEMFGVLQEHLDSLANQGTTVDIQGTAVGGFADQYSAFLHLDGARILDLALENFSGDSPPDVYAMANSLDPVVQGLREVLDVPVLTLMEVACSLAPSLGDRYGILVPNRKFYPMYRDLVASYGSASKLGAIDNLPYDRILDMRGIFAGDAGAADKCMSAVSDGFSRLGDRGADIVIVPGPVGMFLSHSGVTEFDGVRYLDAFGLLLKVAEGIAAMPGLTTSRFWRYAKPPQALFEEALSEYDLPRQ